MKKMLLAFFLLLNTVILSTSSNIDLNDILMSSDQLPILIDNKILNEGKDLKTVNYLNNLPVSFPINIDIFKHISSNFGFRKHPIYKRWIFHNGIDIDAPKGTDIVSTCEGKVIEVEKSKFGYGNKIIIEHCYNFKTLYAHLDSITVKEGQIVKRGDKIGTLGSTGLSTGNHLHYTLMENNIPCDPINFLKENRNNINYFSKVIALKNDKNKLFGMYLPGNVSTGRFQQNNNNKNQV